MNVEMILKEKGADVVTVSASDSIAQAVELLNRHRIGALVVTDGETVCGILSERDIVRALAVSGAEMMTQPVSQFMTSNVVTCGYDVTLDALMDQMTGGRFRHLPVVVEGKLCGLISIGDVVKFRIAETEMEAEQLKHYIASG